MIRIRAYLHHHSWLDPGLKLQLLSDVPLRMPANEANNTGTEQQAAQAGERVPPALQFLPPLPSQVTPHKVAVLQLIIHYSQYRKVMH